MSSGKILFDTGARACRPPAHNLSAFGSVLTMSRMNWDRCKLDRIREREARRRDPPTMVPNTKNTKRDPVAAQEAALIEAYRAVIAERVAADHQAYRERVETWVRDSVARFVRVTNDMQWMVQFLSEKALELGIPFDVKGLVNAIAFEALAAEESRREAEALEAEKQRKASEATIETRVYQLALRGFTSAATVEKLWLTVHRKADGFGAITKLRRAVQRVRVSLRIPARNRPEFESWRRTERARRRHSKRREMLEKAQRKREALRRQARREAYKEWKAERRVRRKEQREQAQARRDAQQREREMAGRDALRTGVARILARTPAGRSVVNYSCGCCEYEDGYYLCKSHGGS
jgi:hypothetical protein